MRVFESIKEAIGPNTVGAGASRPAGRLVVVLSSRAAAHSQKLRWQSSIVELMKLFGVDWRLGQRKRLARELGFAGDAGKFVGIERLAARCRLGRAGKLARRGRCANPCADGPCSEATVAAPLCDNELGNERGATFHGIATRHPLG
jgi:hypothetical protein